MLVGLLRDASSNDYLAWALAIVRQAAVTIGDKELFYEAYGNNLKLAPLVREIGWSHHVIIMEKCKDDLEREFYIRMTRKHGWTKNVLTHQVENQSYEKTLLNQTNFDKNLINESLVRVQSEEPDFILPAHRSFII